MKISVNGKNHDIPPEFSIKQLLRMFDLDQPRIAVAVNAHVVPRSTFDQHQLAEGDRVEILHAVGGG